MSVLQTMMLLGVAACALSFTDARNAPVMTVVFYVPVLLSIAGLALVVRRGHVAGAAWALGLFFWALIAAVLPMFGGMHGHNGAVFCVSVTLIGVLIGRRPALVLAFLASAWCGFVAWLETEGRLPPQLGVYTPLNAWSALTLTLLLTTVLVQGTLDSLRVVHERAVANARERDEALRRSIDAQKMQVVGNLTGGIAHDFNNLLTVIRGTAEHLREEVATVHPDTVALLDDLDAATLRASLMTRQLLAFGKTETAVESVDLGHVVRSLSTMLPRLLDASIACSVEAAEGAWVRATRAGLEQILLNLAVNARDAMPRGGTLSLSVHAEGDVVALIVRDDGVGMDEATQAKVFDAFFTTKVSGTGLGLATVRTLTDRFGGTIQLKSAPGEGTTFELRFPAAPAGSSTIASAASAPIIPSERGRALLVEDDRLVRRESTRILQRAGYEVVPVTHAAEALALLREPGTFEVVVTDIAMPGMDGDALAREIAVLLPEQPVVLCSGNRDPSDETLASPRRAFAPKPLVADELLAAILRVRGE
jgi:signal transduction histidine kinase/CheY-like chemotaxis protein